MAAVAASERETGSNQLPGIDVLYTLQNVCSTMLPNVTQAIGPSMFTHIATTVKSDCFDEATSSTSRLIYMHAQIFQGWLGWGTRSLHYPLARQMHTSHPCSTTYHIMGF